MTKRILFDLVLVMAVFYAPWWFVFPVVSLGAFYFSPYYEAIFVGMLVDVLYGVQGGLYTGYGIAGLIAGSIILIVAKRIKRDLR